MLKRLARTPGSHGRPQWSTPSFVAAGAALFIAIGGSAVAADKMITARDIATGAVTSEKIKNGTIKVTDLNARTRASLRGRKGDAGPSGSAGALGTNGANGSAGANGANGPNGANGAAGINGANGPNGANGAAGADGINGTNGIDGVNGVIAPLSAVASSTSLPTSSSRTVVVTLAVPARNYIVFAKTQLSHTGAGDTVDCYLKAGTTEIDQVSMKTLPALAAVPASLQAVTTTSPTELSLECKVLTAGGSADFTKLIAIPIG